MRRLWIASAVLLAATLRAAPQEPPPEQQRPPPPTFRGGTTLIQVDAIVTDPAGRPVDDLTAADFTVRDDGRPVAIASVRFLGADRYGGDPTLAPIRTHDDEVREASRDDVRLYAIVLDDYHVERGGELRVIDPLVAFVRRLPPTDLVGVYYPLDSVTDVNFARDRAPAIEAIRRFKGRRGDYTPVRPVENEHLRHPLEIERIRSQITGSALAGLAAHLGGLKQGRKSVLFVSEGSAELQDVLEAANRANVAIYPVDWRGMTTAVTAIDRGPMPARALAAQAAQREVLHRLAIETGGRAILDRNDIEGALAQVVRDATAYYLIAYESPRPDDGKFHAVTVRVQRPRANVFARPGYWAFKRDQRTEIAPVTSVTPDIQTALNRLADSLRPNADEPAEPRRRTIAPPAVPAVARLLDTPSLAVVHGRTVGEPAARREFPRTDTLALRAVTLGTPVVTARLLDRLGRHLVDLAVTVTGGTCQLTLSLGSLGPGDYVIELSALGGTESVQQLVAFRVVR